MQITEWVFLAMAVFLAGLGGIAFYVKKKNPPAPPPLVPDQKKIDEVFSAGSKREEIRLIEIRGRMEEARQQAEKGNGEPARDILKDGWAKARGEK